MVPVLKAEQSLLKTVRRKARAFTAAVLLGGALAAAGCAAAQKTAPKHPPQISLISPSETAPKKPFNDNPSVTLNKQEIIDSIRTVNPEEFVQGMGPLAGIWTFAGLPYEKIYENLNLQNKESIQILYPAAGAHMSPLEIAARLQGGSSNIKLVRFIYTEVDNDAPDNFLEYAKKSLGAIKLIGKSEKTFPFRGKEVTLSLLVQGKRVDVVYALDMSSKVYHHGADHALFRRQYLMDSDIVLFHDSFDALYDEMTGFAKTVAYSLPKVSRSGKPMAFIFQDYGSASLGHVPLSAYGMLPGEMIATKGFFGCAEKRKPYGAITYFPDMEKVSEIVGRKSRLEAFKGKLQEVFTNIYENNRFTKEEMKIFWVEEDLKVHEGKFFKRLEKLIWTECGGKPDHCSILSEVDKEYYCEQTGKCGAPSPQ